MWWVIGSILWLMSLAAAGEVQRPRPAPPEGEVRRLIEMFRRGWERNDAEALRQACAPGIVMLSFGRRDRGIEDVLEHLRVVFQHFPQAELQLEDIELRVLGTVAWAQAEARYVQKTAHGMALAYTGYASFLLERQRSGWRIAQVDLNVRPATPTPSVATAEGASLEGAWLLESAKDLATGRRLSQGAMLLFTRSRFALFVVAPDRRPPREKPLTDYSKRELLELVREVEGSVGEYRREGDRLYLVPVFAFFPQMTGEPQIFQNVRLNRETLSVEWEVRGRRLLMTWRRVE
ncbi:MAG: nuclear transport factor 2 family protein [Blastocatellia bacterium]|nr:nuclear transport factor 2 family protein [Blastocatellia bacterium]MCS7157840.1 nuclear transport factor 2 family protein [Blastocatellia bacterium]MCX7753423.1 nuclear transport factor 2 family protein [Blastocatellia bacterium]MDW8168082.1 nuclear transport factor 2 family protein [Acidobacteriota bacterium]MDW8257669.1 nuclear transport factor 2 family protein [Acidobacteriota bacterium]